MSRTVPAVSAPYVVSLGPRCHVACWDKETGDCNWLIDLVLDYGVTVPQWYAGQCPLVDGNHVILAPASPDVLWLLRPMVTDLVGRYSAWDSVSFRCWSSWSWPTG